MFKGLIYRYIIQHVKYVILKTFVVSLLHTSTSFITLGSDKEIWTFPQNLADLGTCV